MNVPSFLANSCDACGIPRHSRVARDLGIDRARRKRAKSYLALAYGPTITSTNPIGADRTTGSGYHAMPDATDENASAAGHAALSICESLLLALGELQILDESDVRGILKDAAATHRGAANATTDAATHRAAATVIEQLLANRKTAHRP